MDVIYALIPSMIFIGLVLVALLFWSIKSGQFDDFEGEGHRILMDEDLTPTKKNDSEKEPEAKEEEQSIQKNIQ
ncbi:MAG: cbb3-type cytochrome oxidase assembly protein CcoS [Pseudomonadota bacterium]